MPPSGPGGSGGSSPRVDTAWARRAGTPLRQFVSTETGSAAFLLAAAIVALIWANVSTSSYDAFWVTRLSVRVGPGEIGAPLREWVNSGLMSFFFLVAGLEARREFDMGELRERLRLTLPLVVGLGGMLVPVGIYLAINVGRASAEGWGTAMSTDTAFALGMLALVGPGVPDRVRTYLLTFAIVDDVAGLIVIAVAYSGRIDLLPLAIGLAVLGAVALLRLRDLRRGSVYLLLGVVAWAAFFKSGVDPIVVGLVVGLLAIAYPASRSDLERATAEFRTFREQPTPELASSAREHVRTAISPNDRLQQIFHPWTSYLIVPLFALANAGIPLSAGFLARAYTAPVTLGIIVGYVAGKPLGTIGAAWLLAAVSRGRIRPPIGWAAVTGAGAIAGIGFTVSLLIASLAFTSEELADAKAGILTGALCASAVTWIIFKLTGQASPAPPGARLARHHREHHRSRCSRRPAPRPHHRPVRRPGHRGRVRGLRVPVLRRVRAGGAGTVVRGGRCQVRVAAPSADRRAPARGAGRPGLRGRRPAGQVLGHARPAHGSPGRTAASRPDRIRT